MEKIKNVKKYDTQSYQNRFFKKMKAMGKKRVGFWLTADQEIAVKKLLQENDMTRENGTYKTEADAMIAAIKEYKKENKERGEGFSSNIYQADDGFTAEVSFSADTRMTVWYEGNDPWLDGLWKNPDSKQSMQRLIEIAIIAEQEGYIIPIQF